MKNKNLIKLFIIIIIVIITIIIGIKIEMKLNEKRMNKYISDNNYSKAQYDIYTLNKENGNQKIIYQVLYENNYFSKFTLTTENTETTKIEYYYTTDKEIIIEYEYSNIKNGNFNLSSVKATYKNNTLKKCEKITGENLNCNDLNDFAINYSNEINNILEKYHININFLKIEK